VLELFAWKNIIRDSRERDVKVLGGKQMKERQGTKEMLLFGGEKEFFF